jgi:hypothetical protein
MIYTHATKWRKRDEEDRRDRTPGERRFPFDSPSKLNPSGKRMRMVMRSTRIVLSLRTLGIELPEYRWLYDEVDKLPGKCIELSLMTMLTNITPDFIAAFNGKSKLIQLINVISLAD